MSFLKLFYFQLFRKTFNCVRNKSTVCAINLGPDRQNQIFNKKICVHQFLTAKYCTTGSNSDVKSENFQDIIRSRRAQARSSVLIELSSRDDIAYIISFVKGIGKVNSILSYTGEHKEVFLLTEFALEESANKLIKVCQLKNIEDTFPFCSRLILFERKKKRKSQLIDIHGFEEVSKTLSYQNNHDSVSDMMKNLYEREKISDLSTRLRFLFGCLIEDSVKGMFPACVAFPFGSSVNGFGKEGCDIDLMLRLCPEKVDSKAEFLFQTKTCVGDARVLQQRSICGIYEIIRLFFPGVTYVQRILQARIPILKFKHKILNLDCDVSVNNMSAVYMSDILHFFGEVDPRVRPLIFAVKKWAKIGNITYDTPGSWVTNFSLGLLVVFFLQNRPSPILPPLAKAVDLSECCDHGIFDAVQYLESIDKWKSIANCNKESLETLLEEFLHFLSSFDFPKTRISVITGEAIPLVSGYPLWIQYPLIEEMNVSKNVSSHELRELIETAKMTIGNLGRQRTNVFHDFESYFGIISTKMQTERIDINALYDDSSSKKKDMHILTIPQKKKRVPIL